MQSSNGGILILTAAETGRRTGHGETLGDGEREGLREFNAAKARMSI